MPFYSKLDPSIEITKDKLAITIIRTHHQHFHMTDQHAMLILESIDAEDKHKVKLAHLTGESIKWTQLQTWVGSHLFHTGKSSVKVSDLSDKEIKYSEKSKTWLVNQADAKSMLEEIDLEATGKKATPPFYLLGGNSIGTYLSNFQRNGVMPKNCIGWALDKVRLTGINLPEHANILALKTSSYTGKNAKLELKNYDAKELCDLIKTDEIQAIRKYFPPGSFNVNQLLSGETAGSVEFHLRNYSPLMLACGYGKWEIAKMLINEYNADVNLDNNSGLTWQVHKQWLTISFNALDCAQKNFFGITTILKDKKGQEEVIALIESKMAKSEPLENNNVCLP